MSIQYLDRESKKIEEEKVYGGQFLSFLYKNSFISKCILYVVASSPLISRVYGWVQKTGWSKKKIKPFIQKFNVDTSEFAQSVHEFTSFNDFFIRKLRPHVRPIANDLCLPADGRYFAIEALSDKSAFLVKGATFNLPAFLGDAELAKRYEGGNLLLARLCPVDYHRVHFPVSCTPRAPVKISGGLYSVNPLATKKTPSIFWENKRERISLETKEYGTVQCVLVGATNVGTIHYSFTPNTHYTRGEELGYFSFGGSALVLLFEKGVCTLAKDIVSASEKGIEVLCKMGQPLAEEIHD